MKLNLIPNLIWLVVSYLAACPLTDLISVDMTQTHWANIMTYVIWAFAGAAWSGIVLAVIAIIAWVNA